MANEYFGNECYTRSSEILVPFTGRTYLVYQNPAIQDGILTGACVRIATAPAPGNYVGKIKVFRLVGTTTVFVGESITQQILSSGPNIFSNLNIPIRAGDYIGYYGYSTDSIWDHTISADYVTGNYNLRSYDTDITSDTPTSDWTVIDGFYNVSIIGEYIPMVTKLRNANLNQGKTNVYKNGTLIGTLNDNDTESTFNFIIGDTFKFEAIGNYGTDYAYVLDKFCDELNVCVTTNPYSGTVNTSEKTYTVYFIREIPYKTLSLNNSITSNQRDDFYSSTTTPGKIIDVYGNYFTNIGDCPTTDWVWYKRISKTQEWKEFNRYCCSDYALPICHSSSYLPTVDTTHLGEYIDKIAVEFNGLRAESWVNRCKVHITAKKDTLNTPLKDVEVYREHFENITSFAVERDNIDPCPTPPCLPDDLTTELINCDPNVSVELMKKKKRNDVLYVGCLGIPEKLTWTISQAGVYTGTMHWQYWNGAAWTYFPEGAPSDSSGIGIVDETNGFKNSGERNVILPTNPIITDWERTKIGNYVPLYVSRAIFDSDLNVTTVPKASCLKWTGQYIITTDVNGEALFYILTNSQVTFQVPGKLPGYICSSGCISTGYTLNEGDSSLELNLTLVKSDLSCSLTLDTPVYKNHLESLKVSSNVSFGNIRNELKITDPDGQVVLDKTDIPKGNVSVDFKYTKLGLHKIELTSKDDGDNACQKVTYSYVLDSSACDTYTDRASCEANKCYWYANKCVDSDPLVILQEIYTSILNGSVCIDSLCIPTLDLNGDNKITETDKVLANSLTRDQAFSKILSYQICKDVYPCTIKNPSGGGAGLIIIAIAAAGIGYYLYKKKNKQKKK